MKVLICGAGHIAVEMLKRFDEDWLITLIDHDEELMGSLPQQHRTVARAIIGDASSPVVLEDANLAGQDYVLALTGRDRVNLAVAAAANDAGVFNVISLVHQSDNLHRFQQLGVKTIEVSRQVSREILQHMEDPRIIVTTIARGTGELLEADVESHAKLMGHHIADRHHTDWRIVGVVRQDQILFHDADTLLQRGDRALILGRPDTFRDVCTMFDCGAPSFPHSYGNIMIIGIVPERGASEATMLKECEQLVRNTKIEQITVLKPPHDSQIGDPVRPQRDGIDIQWVTAEADVLTSVRNAARTSDIGVVVLPLLDRAIIDTLARPVHIGLAHELVCPLLIAKGSGPYERIMVPFTGTPATETALVTGIDIAQQCNARVSVAVVREPTFLHTSNDSSDWLETTLKKVRELARIYQMDVEEIIRSGNPVTELTAAAEDSDLIIIGSTNAKKELLAPHVGEMLVRKTACSALIVTPG